MVDVGIGGITKGGAARSEDRTACFNISMLTKFSRSFAHTGLNVGPTSLCAHERDFLFMDNLLCCECGITINTCLPSANTMARMSKKLGREFTGQLCSLCIQKMGGSHMKQDQKKQIDNNVAFSRISLVLAVKNGDFSGFNKAYESINKELDTLERKLGKCIDQAHFITSRRNEVLAIRDSINERAKESPRASYFLRRCEANKYTSKPEVRARIFGRDGHKCLHCGTKKRLALDHITPVSKGGLDTDENLQTLCIPCNSRKGAQ